MCIVYDGPGRDNVTNRKRVNGKSVQVNGIANSSSYVANYWTFWFGQFYRFIVLTFFFVTFTPNPSNVVVCKCFFFVFFWNFVYCLKTIFCFLLKKKKIQNSFSLPFWLNARSEWRKRILKRVKNTYHLYLEEHFCQSTDSERKKIHLIYAINFYIHFQMKWRRLKEKNGKNR